MRLVIPGGLLAVLFVAASCARTGFGFWPCSGVDCSGHGTCGVTPAGQPMCACDPGYRNSGALACEPVSASGPDAGLDDAAPGLDGGRDASRVDAAIADVAARDTAATDNSTPVDGALSDGAPPFDAANPDRATRIDAATGDSAPPGDAAAPDGAPPVDAAAPDSAPPVDAAIDDASASPDCRLFHPVPLPVAVRSDPVNDFWGAAPDDVHAVTESGSVLHWDGCTIEVEHQVATPLKGIWGSSANDIWAAGSGDAVLRYNGSTWSALTKPSTSDLRDVWGSSADDLWFVGTPIGAATFYVLRWSASGGFVEPRIQNIYVETPLGIWGSAANDVWIVGHYGIVRHNGNRFDQVEYVNWSDEWGAGTVYRRAVHGLAANDVDIVGGSWSWSRGCSCSTYGQGGMRWNGTDFVYSSISTSGQQYAYSVHASSASDRWRVGSARFLQRDQGTGWTNVTECGGPLPVSFNEVYAFAPDDVWFSATGSGIYHYCGSNRPDADGDGHGAAVCGGDDCNDCVGAINPGAPEATAAGSTCSDGVDNDCDGKVDSADEGCL